MTHSQNPILMLLMHIAGWRPTDLTASCKSFPVEGAVKDRRLHPMDCMDIVIGTVDRGSGRSRVGDYYTRDRSTPQPDSFYGGEDDLSGAEGWVSDGNTHIMFRDGYNGLVELL